MRSRPFACAGCLFTTPTRPPPTFSTWHGAGSKTPGEEALRWLYGVARNVVRSHQRGSVRRRWLVAKAGALHDVPAEGPETRVIRSSENEEVAAALDSMRRDDQELLLLKTWEQMPNKTIASILGISVRAVESRYVRALARLAKKLPTDKTGFGISPLSRKTRRNGRMTSIERARRRLESANPVPPSTEFPEATWSSAELLEKVHERRKTMTDTLTPVELTRQAPQTPRRGRGPLIALATAGAVVVVGGIFAAATITGGDGPDVATAPTTVVLEDAGALDVVNQTYRAYKAGDVAGLLNLVSPDATECPGCRPGSLSTGGGNSVAGDAIAQGSRLLVAAGSRVGVTCERVGPNQARCNEEFWSGFGGDRPAQQATVLFTVEDGLITGAWTEQATFSSHSSSESINLSRYRQWLQENHPVDYPELFEFDVRILLDTPERMELHQRYTAEYNVAKS